MNASAPEVPSVVVRRRRGPSVIWFVPILAALAAGAIWWDVEQQRGPEITIRFKTAAGLEAGKTLIKLKDIVIGKVQRIVFEDDLSGVVLHAEMQQSAERFMVDGTRFWVIKPRIGISAVQGLDTLISGAYLNMEAVLTGAPTSEFVGLELPPAAPVDAPGLKLTLTSERLAGLGVGSPVLFLDHEVGLVERHRILPGDDGVEVDIYIDPEFKDRVHGNTRFWNAGGVHVGLGSGGLDVQLESLSALLSGAVAFETFDEPVGDVRSGQRFPLLSDRRIAEQERRETVLVSMVFSESVAGLARGAPVVFQGFEVGEVEEQELVYDPGAGEVFVLVRVALHRHFARVIGEGAPLDIEAGLSDLVAAGLRARLNTANLLTGGLNIALELLPDDMSMARGLDGDLLEIPTVPSTASEITRTMQQLPTITANLSATVDAVRMLVTGPALGSLLEDVKQAVADLGAVGTLVADEIPDLLARVDQVAAATEEAIASVRSSEQRLSRSAEKALDDLSAAMRSVRLLADLLERHPEALLQGKETKR